MNLFLYQGNNYYNRKIIHANTTDDYESKGLLEIEVVSGVAFIANDGITTTQIINYDYESSGFGDYLVVTDEYSNILSRWWVTKNTIVRRGQVMMSLLRDVISDWYDKILVAPSFIRKGYIQSINDTAIYNNEEMNFNQIKVKERPIKDKTNSGWYVGYLSKNLGHQNITVPGASISAADAYESIEDYPYTKYTESNPYIGNYTSIVHNFFCYNLSTNRANNYVYGFDNNGNPATPNIKDYNTWLEPEGRGANIDPSGITRGFKYNLTGIKDPIKDNIYKYTTGITNWEQRSYSITGAHTESETDKFFNSQNGRVIKIDDQYKKVVLRSKIVSRTVEPENGSVYAQNMISIAEMLGLSSLQTSGYFSAITFEAVAYFVVFEDATETTFPYDIPTNIAHTNDVPYDIFAIPADSIYTFENETPSDPQFSKKVVAGIIAGLTSGTDQAQLYDVQYVPYCPLSDIFLFENKIDTNKLANTEDQTNYSLLEEAGGAWTIVIYATEANFTKKIYSHKINTSDKVEDFKIENECDTYRLCSPNYNGQFEFSATKNGGVKGWNITFTYKPFNPYIKVSPMFGRLYGTDFGDARGLVCGGDYSISQVNSAWINYELQNKNYQVMFDRQIQNMETNNSIQRTKEIFGAVTGTIQGGVTGGMAGGMAGPWGAVAGAITGTVASGAGGITDIALNDKLRAEALDYAKDQFGYNLQNIKALPYSLTKVGSQNSDYKVWPFVESYTCTEIEKSALKSKLKWNGYSIHRIGYINNFLNPEDETFIQCKIIRLDVLGADGHIANVINTELQTGVYFT